MQASASQSSDSITAHGLPLPTSEAAQSNRPKSIDAPCWRGFSTRVEDIAENARFLNHVVAATRSEVVGNSHLVTDFSIHYPSLKPIDLVRMTLHRGPFVTGQVKKMNLGYQCLQGIFRQNHDLSNIRTSDIYFKFSSKNGFGDCGSQVYQCRKNLLKAGVPADIIWALHFSNRRKSDTPHDGHCMLLIADNQSMERLFDQMNIVTAKYGVENKKRPGIAMDVADFFFLLQEKLPNLIFVDPFNDQIIPGNGLNTTPVGIFLNFGLRGEYSVSFTGSNDYLPISDDELEFFERKIKGDKKAVKAMQDIKTVVHNIKLIRLIDASEIASRLKQKITVSIGKSEFGLAFRQCAYYKANSVFDYLYDHAGELDFDLNSSGNSGNTALDYAKKAGNSHAIVRLETLKTACSGSA
ncbi:MULTISPECIES: hypothetical protein [unclassified Endozoicomonas]|uniref:hypothetical protein n=1 Tax=unclassified Endozoicomonas TaxID=2644528 RepID=UPI003BB69C96